MSKQRLGLTIHKAGKDGKQEMNILSDKGQYMGKRLAKEGVQHAE